MTTAARPTWLPAVGGGSLRDTAGAPTQQKSAKELPSHTTIKLRQTGQNAPGELLDREAMKQKLLAAERASAAAIRGGITVDEHELEEKRRELLQANLDADDEVEDDKGSDDERRDVDSNDSDDDSDNDDDDEAELMRELEKIKRERAEEKERQEREKREEEERAREEAMLAGNPLLNPTAVSASTSSAVTVSGGFAVKRRWDDDVIFKNQARGVEEKPKKRFVNDLLRSDFHRKFMSKYVR